MASYFRSVPCLAAATLALGICSCTPEPATPRGGGGVPSIAVVEATEGEASVIHESKKLVAAPGLRLASGDRLETGTPGKMRVRMSDDTVLAIGSNTKLALAELSMDEETRRGRIDVALGRFWMNVTQWTGKGESRFEVATPNAVAGIRGTTLWGDTDVDAICALEGTIEVRSRRNEGISPATLSAGSCVSRLSEGELAPLTPTSEQLQKFLGEVLIRTK
jgi:hypothetical protein